MKKLRSDKRRITDGVWDRHRVISCSMLVSSVAQPRFLKLSAHPRLHCSPPAAMPMQRQR